VRFVCAGRLGLKAAGRDELRVEGPGLEGLDAAAKEQVRDPHDARHRTKSTAQMNRTCRCPRSPRLWRAFVDLTRTDVTILTYERRDDWDAACQRLREHRLAL
jgi:hypothetical protein